MVSASDYVTAEYLDKFANTLLDWLLTDIGCGVSFSLVWAVMDLLVYIVTFFILFKVIKPLVNVICEKIKNKK